MQTAYAILPQNSTTSSHSDSDSDVQIILDSDDEDSDEESPAPNPLLPVAYNATARQVRPRSPAIASTSSARRLHYPGPQRNFLESLLSMDSNPRIRRQRSLSPTPTLRDFDVAEMACFVDTYQRGVRPPFFEYTRIPSIHAPPPFPRPQGCSPPPDNEFVVAYNTLTRQLRNARPSVPVSSMDPDARAKWKSMLRRHQTERRMNQHPKYCRATIAMLTAQVLERKGNPRAADRVRAVEVGRFHRINRHRLPGNLLSYEDRLRLFNGMTDLHELTYEDRARQHSQQMAEESRLNDARRRARTLGVSPPPHPAIASSSSDAPAFFVAPGDPNMRIGGFTLSELNDPFVMNQIQQLEKRQIQIEREAEAAADIERKKANQEMFAAMSPEEAAELKKTLAAARQRLQIHSQKIREGKGPLPTIRNLDLAKVREMDKSPIRSVTPEPELDQDFLEHELRICLMMLIGYHFYFVLSISESIWDFYRFLLW